MESSTCDADDTPSSVDQREPGPGVTQGCLLPQQKTQGYGAGVRTIACPSVEMRAHQACIHVQDRPASAPASPQLHQRVSAGGAWPASGRHVAPYSSVGRGFPRGLAGYQRRSTVQNRNGMDESRAGARVGITIRRMKSAPETPSRLLVGRKTKPAVKLAGARDD